MLANHSENSSHAALSTVSDDPAAMRNSDRIKIKFGSYNIDIIENNTDIRVSKLYSTHDGVKTNRTFAVVTYPASITAEFRKEHEAISGGQSIGEVFEQNGWSIDKQHQYFGEIELPLEHAAAHTLFNGVGKRKAAIHIYKLVVSKAQHVFDYALIAEVHHPDFLELKDLRSIYAQGSDDEPAATEDIGEFLEVVHSKIEGLL